MIYYVCINIDTHIKTEKMMVRSKFAAHKVFKSAITAVCFANDEVKELKGNNGILLCLFCSYLISLS